MFDLPWEGRNDYSAVEVEILNALDHSCKEVIVVVGLFYGGDVYHLSKKLESLSSETIIVGYQQATDLYLPKDEKLAAKLLARHNSELSKQCLEAYDFNQLINILDELTNVMLVVEQSPPKLNLHADCPPKCVLIDVSSKLHINEINLNYWLSNIADDGIVIIGDHTIDLDNNLRSKLKNDTRYRVTHVVDNYICVRKNNV